MILDNAAILPFLDAFADNGDWQSWVCIADTFADAWDEIGYQWACLVRNSQRKPWVQHVTTLNKSYTNAGWDVWQTGRKSSHFDLPCELSIHLGHWLYPCFDEQQCYIRLLDAWRSISDEERAKIAGATMQV